MQVLPADNPNGGSKSERFQSPFGRLPVPYIGYISYRKREAKPKAKARPKRKKA